MRATIESTTKIVEVDGVQARVWEGVTAAGVRFCAFITRVAVLPNEDASQFEAELLAMKTPSAETQSFPPRIVL
jgi:hypothetical protein